MKPHDASFKRAKRTAGGLSGQRGMTLIELMIGLMIGLIVSGAALAVFLAINRMGKTHGDSGKLLEEGGFVSQRMTVAIKRSGYVDLLADNFVFNQIIDGKSALGKVIESPNAGNLDKFGALYFATTGLSAGIFGCENGVLSASSTCTTQGCRDALLVAYQATTALSSSDPFAPSVPTSVSDGSAFSDCNGKAPPAGSDVIINRYFVNAQDELMCMGNGDNQSRVLAVNVDQFQVLYGVSNWSVSEPIRRVSWQTAAQVTAANRWNSVIQVDLCLITRGPVGSTLNPGMTNNCDGSTSATSDTRLRKTFRTIVSLRNAPLSS